MKKIMLLSLLLMLMLFFNNAYAEEIINTDANIKTLHTGDITVIAPYNTVCDWQHPTDDFKVCTVDITVINHADKPFVEKGKGTKAFFKHNVVDMQIFMSDNAVVYNRSVLNSTCFNLKDSKLYNKTQIENMCSYNITDYTFSNWKKRSKLTNYKKNSVTGVRLVFKSPILIDAHKYLKNQFNFSIAGVDNDVLLDPYISECSVLSSAGATYTMNGSIINSSTNYCINISANNITLDCAGYTIDGDDAADYGIYVKRASSETTNVTIKNCIVTDWDTAGIRLGYANGNNLTNISANSNSYYGGVSLQHSDSNKFINISASSNSYCIHSQYSDSNTFTNITASSNNYGIYSLYSDSNTFTKITVNSNTYNGIYSQYSDSNTFTNITASSNNAGIYFLFSNSNTFTNITANSNTLYGIYIDGNLNTIKESTIYSQSGTDDVGLFISDDDNLIYNNTIYSNYYGIQLDTTATNNTLYDNRIYSNTYGIYMNGAGNGEVNLIYNNLFNQTDNVKFGTVYANNWNTTNQTGTRIYSIGTQIGGNYWTNSTGNGYSDTCTDSNIDGFCDDYYNLTNGNIDWLPLISTADVSSPIYSDNSTNSTIHNTMIKHSLKWQDNINLSGYIFSFDNGTGSFTNDSWVSMTGTLNWSNITKMVNSTVGSTIRWKVYANDSSNNWNTSETYTYNTTNTLPTQTPVTLTPLPAETTDNLTCNYVYSDADNDTESGVWFQWYVNGVENITTQNMSYTITSLDDNIICSVKVSDGYENSTWVNSTTLTIGDAIAPVLHTHYMSATTGIVNTAFTIGVNITEANTINYVYVEITDPNAVAVNYTMSLDTNGGLEHYYVKTYTPSTVGTYTFKFYAQDGSGNDADMYTGTYNYTATTAEVPSGGGGGGIITTPAICGNGVCESGESTVTCPQDCILDFSLIPVVNKTTFNIKYNGIAGNRLTISNDGVYDKQIKVTIEPKDYLKLQTADGDVYEYTYNLSRKVGLAAGTISVVWIMNLTGTNRSIGEYDYTMTFDDGTNVLTHPMTANVVERVFDPFSYLVPAAIVLMFIMAIWPAVVKL